MDKNLATKTLKPEDSVRQTWDRSLRRRNQKIKRKDKV